MEKNIDVIGFGNPVLDLLIEVEDFFLDEVNMVKGEMHLSTKERTDDILSKLKDHEITKIAGGSCANTIYGVAYLGGKSAFCGVIGDDEHGKTYELSFENENIKTNFSTSDQISGHAVTLITKDGQRTFATHLGAAIEFKDHHVLEEDIKHAKILHLEGYQIEGEESYKAMLKAVEIAKKYDTLVSIDLSDPALVFRKKDLVKELLNHIDIVFANEEEAKEYTGLDDPLDSLHIFSKTCKYSIVKIGAKGSLIKHNNEIIKIEAKNVNVVDTTGAGDLYAAGFLYGITNGKSIRESGEIAADNASKVISKIGARLE